MNRMSGCSVVAILLFHSYPCIYTAFLKVCCSGYDKR